MKRFRSEQMELCDVPAADIRINPRSIDDVPKILRGIRTIVSNREFRANLVNLLEAGYLPCPDNRQGRLRLDLWRIFVLGVLERRMACDVDRLPRHANHDALAAPAPPIFFNLGAKIIRKDRK